MVEMRHHGHIKGLAVRDYVEMRRDPADVWATPVSFTPRGLELRRRGFDMKRTMLDDTEPVLGRKWLIDVASALELRVRVSRFDGNMSSRSG